MPSTVLTDADFTDGEIGLLALLVRCGLAASNGEARRLCQQGGIEVDGEKCTDGRKSFAKAEFADGKTIKKGKKVFHKATL